MTLTLFLIDNFVRQMSVLGPILNNCSLDKVCKEGTSFQNGVVGIRLLEFVDDTPYPNDGL